MKIELPDTLKTWLEHQAQSDDHPSVDAYVAAVLQELKVRYHKQIDQALLEGLNSGEPVEITPEWWAERRRKLDVTEKSSGKAAS